MGESTLGVAGALGGTSVAIGGGGDGGTSAGGAAFAAGAGMSGAMGAAVANNGTHNVPAANIAA
jgi:hypothetical protein